MPEIGEVKNSLEIGRKYSNLYIWVACIDCGKERWVKKARWVRHHSLRCRPCAEKARRGKNSPLWKGGRTLDSEGYVRIRLQPDNFFYPMAQRQHWVFEHRLVMAKHLGRCLQPWELVHHKDGIKDNNQLSNLELTVRGSHQIEHSKGYRDGYRQGYLDGQSEQMRELKQEIKLLLWQIKESQSKLV